MEDCLIGISYPFVTKIVLISCLPKKIMADTAMRSGQRLTHHSGLKLRHTMTYMQRRFFGELPFLTKSIIRDILERKIDHHGNSLDEKGKIIRPEVSQEEHLKSAKHESGHAIVAHYLGFRVIEINSKICGVRKHGSTLIDINDGFNRMSREVNLDHICFTLAGRASETIDGENNSLAGSDDIFHADILIRQLPPVLIEPKESQVNYYLANISMYLMNLLTS